jgi:phage shock protein PspC (stress-responsive transcriptional regulator)
VDLAPPSLDATPAPEPPPGTAAAPDRILGGVAARLADRLDVDAVWIRIAFVLLALVSGIGVLLYAALWLAFVAGTNRPWLRLVGGALLVVGLPLLLSNSVGRFHTGPVATVGLLAGLAVALWQPRRSSTPGRAPSIAAPSTGPADPPELLGGRAASPRWVRPPRRPPSILGRLTVGIAVLVAAAGALIDQANGGRLHPEQWLGAGAIVCGAGLLASTVVGRARWLVVPALLFATTGFIAGESARIGLRPTALTGTQFIFIGSGNDTRSSIREHVVVGDVELQIDGTPDHQVLVDARAGLGEVRIYTAADVTLEVHTRQDDDVRVDGISHAPGTFTVGPAGRPAVIVTAAVGHGHINVNRYQRPAKVPMPTTRPARQLIPVGDGIAITEDGSIVLANGEAMIGADDQVAAGNHTTENRITSIETSYGVYRLLPEGLLLVPSGGLLDLHALRQSHNISTPTTVGAGSTELPEPTTTLVPVAPTGSGG